MERYLLAVFYLSVEYIYPLYFYKNETARSEIDMIIQQDGKIVPIEIKKEPLKGDMYPLYRTDR